ncbi:group II intron reverse transcriptase/maturase [Lewinella sp. 4G2]|uniref:group II intron reverse transcriptase/maturase n=1 Tax=Lewinella sp. 4G2 TaxID=1803372 RepID=UPI0007B4CB70|nr:group II intron reverse transcriptase/maturase [Lewinella sp. 4G2]OAV45114.1 group II intron reverse transcriptase/maturase [Lewinella sp. 4G2]
MTTPSGRKVRHRKINWHRTRGLSKLTPKHFLDAYQKVRRNAGGPGVDGVTLADFALDLTGNLYTLWNRVTSGSYHPAAVRRKGIPKGNGQTRYLGIPTVGDRIVQQVIKDRIEYILEAEFMDCSYGYRPGRSQHDALQVVRLGVRQTSWVVDLDVSKFFDEMPHDLLRKALDRHITDKQTRDLIDRWLEAPHQDEEGQLHYPQGVGTPQGGVVSPLLSNLFLHYTLDKWMAINRPEEKLVRYADDAIIFCHSRTRAEMVKRLVEERFRACGLRLHHEKTRIVFCKRSNNASSHENISFDFLGYRFKPCSKRTQSGKLFTSFDGAMSPKKKKLKTAEFRAMKFHLWNTTTLEKIAEVLNPILRGILNYYGRFNPHGMESVMMAVNDRLCKWASRKYRKVGKSIHRVRKWLRTTATRRPELFAHWQWGFTYI